MKQCILFLALYTYATMGFSQRLKIEVPVYDITLNKGFDIADVFLQNGAPYMYCYDTQTGMFGVWNMSDGNNPITHGNVKPAWDMLKMYSSKSSFALIKAKNEKSGVKSILSKSTLMNELLQSKNVHEYNYSGSWSFLNSYNYNKNQFLFLYSHNSGAQQIFQLGANIDSSVVVWDKSIEKGIDFFDIVSTSTHHYILIRSLADKKISLLRYNLDGTDNKLSWIPDHNNLTKNRRLSFEVTTNWSHSKLFYYNDAIYVFLYQKSSGAIKVFAVDERVRSLTCVFNTSWSADWSNFSFIYIDGNPYIFHQKESNGLARLSRIVINPS